MSVFGSKHRLWVARSIDYSHGRSVTGELLALVQSKHNVDVQDVKHEILHALGIYNKAPTMGIFEDFTVAEWNTWLAFELVPVFDIRFVNQVKWRTMRVKP